MQKSGVIIVSLICLLAVLVAGGTALALTPSTGDKVLDSRLDAINTYAEENHEAFVSGISETYNVDRMQVEGMLEGGMTPADVYMMLRSAEVTGQSTEMVEKAYLSNPGKGWGVISKSLGIKPGSEEFKSLKSGTDVFTGKDMTAAGGKAKSKDTGKTGKGSDKSGGSNKGGGGKKN
jgi:hypothetical protein